MAEVPFTSMGWVDTKNTPPVSAPASARTTPLACIGTPTNMVSHTVVILQHPEKPKKIDTRIDDMKEMKKERNIAEEIIMETYSDIKKYNKRKR
jgi:hypothetical protein